MNSAVASKLSLCVKCGSCKTQCPTGIEFANEGMSARGRIALLKKLASGELEPSDALDDRIFSCLLCGACNSLCPLGIPITEAIYDGRRKLSRRKKHWMFKFAMKYAFSNTSRAFNILQTLENIGMTRHLNRLKPFNALKELCGDIPKDRLRSGPTVFRVSNPIGRIALFAGCTVDFLYPSMGNALIQSLNALQYEVVLPKGEVCCGAPLLSLGLKDKTAALAEKNLNAFKRLKAEAVISLCPTCTHFISHEYRELVGEGIDNAVDISRFLCDNPAAALQAGQHGGGHSVIYHDPCHSINYLGVKNEPRSLLKTLGFRVIEPAEKGCCGMGGTVRLMYGNVSQSLLEQRIQAFGLGNSNTPEMIVTSCPNCILQLSSRIKDRPVKHIIEIIAASMKRRS
ncbi:MAG TPA: (Fe-S)-binding protein [Dissulfurispiraceae bacterium]|nr:(Fe-S)-binding protein [Dissulfurispiraceae bacterium]